MTKFKQYAFLLLATVMVFGCSKYDDTELKNDVNDLKSRVEKLETWCNTTNGQITALQGLVSALEEKDFVTGVTPIMEGTKEVGYTITFAKGKPITIMHGKDGAKGDQGVAGKDGVTPIIGVKQDTDGYYYWTVKIGDAPVEWMKDTSGNNIRTIGDKGDKGEPGEDGQPGAPGADGHSPVLSVAEFEGRLYWQIDGKWLLSNEQKVPATGDKGEAGAQGDAIFAKDGIDYSTDPENVIFTLADGITKITLPKSSIMTIGFDSYDTFYCSETDNEVAIVLPIKLKETDYNAMIATISNANGTDMDIKTRSASANTWGVEVIKPTFADGALVAGSAKVKLVLPQDKTNYKALLKVTLIDSKGKEYSASRVVWFKADKDVNVIDNTTGALSGKITNPASVKQLSVVGSVSYADFRYISTDLTSLEVLDLSRSTITKLPEWAMWATEEAPNMTLKTVILPETLTTIEDRVFIRCVNLKNINMPKSVRTLGRWMFEGCSSIEEVEIPQGVTEIPASAFYGAGIKRVIIPSSVTTIGNWAFSLCHNLTSIIIPSSVTSLGESVLRECANLTSADIQANVNTLLYNFFYQSRKLNKVKLSSSITTLENNSFCGTGLTEFVIPTQVSVINPGAFSYNVNLETVSIPAGAVMAFSIFTGCTKLRNVIIAEGVTKIDAETFRECSSLEEIVLPSTITAIGDRTFQDCSSLVSLICKATIVPALVADHNGTNYGFHFLNINKSCILKRPAGSDYSQWDSYFGGGVQDL